MNPKRDYDSILSRNRAIIYNGSTNSALLERTAKFGYDADRFGEGLRLQEQAETIMAKQVQAQGEQIAAKEQYAMLWKETDGFYREIRKLAKIALDSMPEAIDQLGLAGKLSRQLIPFLATAEQFCAGVAANPSLLEKLRQYQITESTTAELANRVERLKQARAVVVQKESGVAVLVKAKIDAVQALSRWVAAYIKIARIATKGTQLLEALGITVK